jgi:hypothetical protein
MIAERKFPPHGSAGVRHSVPRDPIPVDLVYTYVEGDSAHAEQRMRYRSVSENVQGTTKDDSTRYCNVGEIRYGVRSALRHMPWIRHILIVTDSQKPPVDSHLLDSGRVRIVNHREFIPETYLPTFNSIAIESFLHRIDGLSDIYLYDNDDSFHFAAVPESAFFHPENDGKVGLNLYVYFAIRRRAMQWASRFLPSPFAPLLANPHTTAIANAFRLLRQKPCCLPWHEIIVPMHVTHVYRKDTARRLDGKFESLLDANRRLRFRTQDRFSYSTLAYSMERIWHPQDRLRTWSWTGMHDEIRMFDFTALFADRRKLWKQVASSRAMFACLNNIHQTDRSIFEKTMRAKGLGAPCDEPNEAE